MNATESLRRLHVGMVRMRVSRSAPIVTPCHICGVTAWADCSTTFGVTANLCPGCYVQIGLPIGTILNPATIPATV